jgi:hypothetical protein
MVGIKIKPIVGGMTSHQWMRVFDLSLPETQTQLLSKIESNDSTLHSLYRVLLTQKGGGQLTNEHKWCGEGKKYQRKMKIME